MCVIAVSEKGKDIPSVEQIKTMWAKNPDGAGYAFVGENGKVFYRKGFMTLDSLLKELEHPEKFKNTLFAVHFRIGTSGKNDRHTCHPFPVSTRYEELRAMEGRSDAVLFHNGIIADGGIVAHNSSDTQDFVVAMAPLLRKYSKSKARDHFINEMVTGNRLFVMYKNGKFKMYGDWKKDGDLWVSNLLYKDDYKWSGYGYEYSGYSQSWWDEWYAEQAYKKYGNKKKQANSAEQQRLLDYENQLWWDIISKQHKFITPAELATLKAAADEVNNNTLVYAGHVFGYDEAQELIWLEETPVAEITEGEEEMKAVSTE